MLLDIIQQLGPSSPVKNFKSPQRAAEFYLKLFQIRNTLGGMPSLHEITLPFFNIEHF